MRHLLIGVASLVAGVAGPAMATTTILDGHIQTYRAPDGSSNYTEVSALWGTSYATVGLENLNTGVQSDFNGRFAATIEFGLDVLPSDAIIKSATLTLGILAHNDSIDTLSYYSASAISANVSRATAGTLITAFDTNDYAVSPNSPPLPITVTSATNVAFGGTALAPILGFSIQQVVDRCARGPDGDACISIIGTTEPGFIPQLSITYDVPVSPPPPPPAAVPEPATWAMFIGGFGLVGGATRRRRKVRVAFL